MTLGKGIVAGATLVTLFVVTGALVTWLFATPAVAQGTRVAMDPDLVRWAFASAAAAAGSAGLAPLAAG